MKTAHADGGGKGSGSAWDLLGWGHGEGSGEAAGAKDFGWLILRAHGIPGYGGGGGDGGDCSICHDGRGASGFNGDGIGPFGLGTGDGLGSGSCLLGCGTGDVVDDDE